MEIFYISTVQYSSYKAHVATDKLKCSRVTADLNSSFYLAAFFFFKATQHGMQDLSSPTRDQTHALSSESTES